MVNTSTGVSSVFGGLYAGASVFVTGHTGFKGAWLTEWLLGLGAKVTGFSLPPPTTSALFTQLGLESRIHRHVAGDIRELESLRAAVLQAQPDFVFHLAAQSLVRASYAQPVETFATNVGGTVHVLEALRGLNRPCATVVVTSDKCYENREWVHGYREEDPMGGHDPYSASKGAAEIVTAAYRRSFFARSAVRIATARAGNVIGGGDWAADRIVPDCVRALQAGQAIPVRNPRSTRPWQHVLEPLSGYLWLAAALAKPRLVQGPPDRIAGAFNFGPAGESNRTVLELVTEILRHCPGTWLDQSDPHAAHEASLLQLSTDKARAWLAWHPTWGFADAIQRTVEWYRRCALVPDVSSVAEFTASQVEGYTQAARQQNQAWATCPPES